MSNPAFPPQVAAALDRLTVPALPQGFADRLLARIDAGDLPAEPVGIAESLPKPRQRFRGTGWRRSGGLFAIAATFSLATATAAASGFFGEPVYVPVVSDALAKAKLMELPERHQAKSAPQPKAAPVSTVIAVETTKPTPTGREAVRSLYQRLRSDPEFRALPRQERIALARQEIRTLLQNGDVTMPELRQAMAEHRLRTNPAIRQAVRGELMRRKLQQDAIGTAAPAIAAQPADVAPVTPAIDVRRQALRELAPEQRARIRDLRRQLRTGTPSERRAIRQELQSIWQSQNNHPVDEKFEPASEGNDPVVR
ncbi:MAG: hypothetical protein ACK4SJ_01165 [Sphingorhabdus sp.]